MRVIILFKSQSRVVVEEEEEEERSPRLPPLQMHDIAFVRA